MATTFKQLVELEEGTVLLVDCINLGFRWKHSGAATFLNEYMATVESLRKSYKAQYVILLCDLGSSSYRKNIYPEYKGNREKLRAEQTEEEANKFKVFFDEFNRVMKAYEEQGIHTLLRFSKVEADDLAAYIVAKRKYFGFKKIWMISTDRDWDLLINEEVSRFSYITRKEVTLETWSEHYDCDPEDYISIKCLQGDSGDNIFGVDKVGPKKALDLVKKYGTAYDIADALPIASKYVYINNLNKFGAENIHLNYQLMDLLTHCEEAIGEANIAVINAKLRKLNDCV